MDEFTTGFSAGVFSVLGMVLLFTATGSWKEEWNCEQSFNVYDCEYEWYPVYGEEIPEEELIP